MASAGVCRMREWWSEDNESFIDWFGGGGDGGV